ncbi:MAG: thioredoxin family protein [bacterium]|nr:thioredoxin family protein [bacterium]
MRNKIIILLVFLVPLAVFAFLQHTTKDYAANATVQSQASSKGKLLKFFSPMCSECKKVGANVSSVMKDYGDYIIYEEIDVSNKDQKTQNLIEAYKVTVVPTVIFIDKDGKTVNKSEGMIEEIEIRNNLDTIK